MKSCIKHSWLLIILIFSSCGEKLKTVETETITLSGVDQIVQLKDSLVKPVLYNNIPTFNDLPVEQSKQKFIATVLPAILVAKFHITSNRDRISSLATKKRLENFRFNIL